MRLSHSELEIRNAKIIEQYKSGLTNKEIASMCDIAYSTVCSVVKKYRQDNEVKKNTTGNDDIMQSADEETIYMETLYAYTKSFIKINECAIEGMEVKKLKQKVAQTKDAFKILSGMDAESTKEKKVSHSTNMQSVDGKILYSGWLRCPHCGKKLHKVFENTSMGNFPLWCKQCHKTTIINV